MTTTRTQFFSLGAALVLLFGVSFSISIPSAHAAIMNQLDLGSTGFDVTQLQTYLATNPEVYPSGLVTGFFGPLTEAGVQGFQSSQAIVSDGTPQTTGYGRVGPLTILRVNTLVTSAAMPGLTDPTAQVGSTGATITWTGTEPTTGQIYLDTVPLSINTSNIPHQLPYVSGTLFTDGAGLQVSHSVTIQNLQSNTIYYYIVRGIDVNGDMSMTWPLGAFRTNP